MAFPDHVWTTSERSAGMKGRPWLRYRAGRDCVEPRIYAFTDGSSRGSYAAVLVHPGGSSEQQVHWREPTKTRNVGAEWDAFVLGLEMSPKAARLTSVVDLLWIHAQLIGVRDTIEPEIVQKLERAKRLIETRELDLVLVHHDGHQKDASDFTKWNAVADRLCSSMADEKTGKRAKP